MNSNAWWGKLVSLAKTGERCVVLDPESGEALVVMTLEQYQALGKNTAQHTEKNEHVNQFSPRDDQNLPVDDAWYIEPIEGQTL